VKQQGIDYEPAGIQLIKRYKSNYKIPDEAPVTEAMILHHWALEKKQASLLQKASLFSGNLFLKIQQ
jgi:hypothetical protein